MAMKHASGRESDLVSNDCPISSAISESATVSIGWIDEIEVLRHAALANCILDRWPREATSSSADDESLVVVLVEWVLRSDIGTILEDDVHDGAILKRTTLCVVSVGCLAT